MPAVSLDNAWSVIGLNVTLLGAVILWTKMEIYDVEKSIKRGKASIVSEARVGQLTDEEFELAITYRDDRIAHLELKHEQLMEKVANQAAISRLSEQVVPRIEQKIDRHLNTNHAYYRTTPHQN